MDQIRVLYSLEKKHPNTVTRVMFHDGGTETSTITLPDKLTAVTDIAFSSHSRGDGERQGKTVTNFDFSDAEFREDIFHLLEVIDRAAEINSSIVIKIQSSSIDLNYLIKTWQKAYLDLQKFYRYHFIISDKNFDQVKAPAQICLGYYLDTTSFIFIDYSNNEMLNPLQQRLCSEYLNIIEYLFGRLSRRGYRLTYFIDKGKQGGKEKIIDILTNKRYREVQIVSHHDAAKPHCLTLAGFDKTSPREDQCIDPTGDLPADLSHLEELHLYVCDCLSIADTFFNKGVNTICCHPAPIDYSLFLYDFIDFSCMNFIADI